MVSYAIIVANFTVFVITLIEPDIIRDLAFRPIYLEDAPRWFTAFTSMFLHSRANFVHILSNMIFLFLIGIPFEQAVGRKKFVLIYLSTGVVATLAFAFFEGAAHSYLIGASGAIFGILGAFAASYPLKKIVVPVFAFLIFFVRLPVIVVALLYAGIETLFVVAGVVDATAHTAHLGGFVAGVFLYPLVKIETEEKHRLRLDDVKELATTGRQRELLERVLAADEPELRDAWLSELARELSCPKCGGRLRLNGRIRCTECDYAK
jgi:membrane associated rhomboid family serine protease